ncbi:MAG: SDR family oxidoreductase [Cytophagales bacterium]|nr:SDR family oxidoreductase [Cytophagales bacterium]
MTKKKALITGAASGIGRATALRFAQEGYDVAVLDVNSEGIYHLMTVLAQGNHISLAGNMVHEETIIHLQKQIATQWNSTVDVLVHCAGKYTKSDLNKMGTNEWLLLTNEMLTGALNMSKLAIKYMASGGRIIYITSIHDGRAEAGSGAYAMAKAAIGQLCRTLAVELAPTHILVNAIAPGFVDTAMSVTDGVNELKTDWFIRNYIHGHHLPLQRPALPEEIAGIALFLASKDASYITGQTIIADGGLSITF